MPIIKPGTLAIFTMCDEPSARMIAVVTKVTKDKIYGRYLCDRPIKHCDPWVAGEGKEKRCTPISEFGVTARISMKTGVIACQRTSKSRATYLDGKPRDWQDRTGNVGYFDSAKRRRWAQWALNKEIAAENVREMGESIKKRVANRRRMQAA